MKTVDTKEYISMLRTLIEEGKQVSMIISGSSMAPFLIHARDHICLKSPSGELRKGDMVFYQRSNGEYVMHRIYNVKNEEYYLIGDAQTVIEGPIQREQIFRHHYQGEAKREMDSSRRFPVEILRPHMAEHNSFTQDHH